MTRVDMSNRRSLSTTLARAAACALLALTFGCGGSGQSATYTTFASPEEAVGALTKAVKDGKLDQVSAMFGPDSKTLIDSSDAVTAQRNRETFSVAVAEGWRLESPNPNTRTLIIGNEQWPFPIPIVKDGNAWRFDTAAGLEEVLARRIGKNELAVIGLCRAYVAAQQIYARTSHDGRPPGLYAASFRSDDGKQNGLYWDAAHGEKRSPLGDLVAAAAAEGRAVGGTGSQPSPFHGYYFRILTAQGEAAPGGAKTYLKNGELSDGFALVAWPSQYDVTGVMTFIVNQDGVVRERDLGQGTDAAAKAMTAYNPDSSWTIVQ
jgi:hypothetical protein